MPPVDWIFESRVVSIQVSSIDKDLKKSKSCDYLDVDTFWQASRSATALGKGTQSPRSTLTERQVGTYRSFKREKVNIISNDHTN